MKKSAKYRNPARRKVTTLTSKAAVTLSEDDVLRIHNALVEEFADTNNPIDPPGVKDYSLFGSAVSRQHSGLGGTLKYPAPLQNAATLTFGICCDHAFHNGNKRTALVALLVHLDKNHLSLAGIPDADLFALMISIAEHEVVLEKSKFNNVMNRPHVDDEVEAIADWLRQRVKPLNRGERQIKYNQLRKILSRFGYELDDPYGNAIQIYRPVEERSLFRSPRIVRQHITTIGYPRESAVVAIQDIKKIRNKCKLLEEDGVDSDAFYSDGAVIDSFINQHRKILQRLANK